MLMINTINATVQANTPDALRGRVMSFYVTVFAGSAPVGGLFAGAVAEAWGVPAAFLAGAALSFLTLGVVALGLRAARRRGHLGVTSLDGSATRTRAPGAPEAEASQRRAEWPGSGPGAPRAPRRPPRAGRGERPSSSRAAASSLAHGSRSTASNLGEGQDHGAPVLGIVLALDEPSLGQGRREPRDDGSGHDQVPCDLGLGCGPVVSIRRMTLYC